VGRARMGDAKDAIFAHAERPVEHDAGRALALTDHRGAKRVKGETCGCAADRSGVGDSTERDSVRMQQSAPVLAVLAGRHRRRAGRWQRPTLVDGDAIGAAFGDTSQRSVRRAGRSDARAVRVAFTRSIRGVAPSRIEDASRANQASRSQAERPACVRGRTDQGSRRGLLRGLIEAWRGKEGRRRRVS